jgi:hypothetical protein
MTARYYDVFGGTLHSEVEIDDLPESPVAAADWTLRVAEAADAPDGELLGSDVVFGDTSVRGFRTPQGFALVFDDTGRFDVSRDGSLITWHRPSAAPTDSGQADLTSRVLALALHARGVFTLHASAVSIEGNGLAFMAPKYHGKSTLCSALVLAGARALSDDTVPVQPGNVPRLAPGLPSLRLWSDTASRLFGVGDESEGPRKHHVSQFTEGQLELRPVPFRAAYVLNPVASLPDGAAAVRERLDTVAATMMLVRHAKLGPILAGTEAPVMLGLSADIARVVPVYALHVLRDLDRLDEVSRQVIAWHADEPGHPVKPA